MDSASSPSLPFTSDPALYEDWEEEVRIAPVVLPSSSTYSDDLEALHLVQEETIARKNKEGVVIQHRAWPLAEVFRSEADHIEGATFHQPFKNHIKQTSSNTLTAAPWFISPASSPVFTTKSQNAFCLISNCISAELPSTGW
jgi:chromosome transmission fidelity protein 18